MTAEYCYGFVCFIPLDVNGPKFFGFSEFLAGLALMVLAWTIADIRYHFRTRITSLPLQGLTFSMVAAVGVLTLATDLWRAEQWLVPKGNFLTPATWQALLGGLFLMTFLTWTWFAFIRPPVYGKRNAKRYARALYRVILKGSPVELAVIADEFAHSTKSLVRYATDRGEGPFRDLRNREQQREAPPKVTAYANDILLLIADKRFCRSIVESSPGTALAIFQEMGETKKFGIRIETFAKNIVNEALANRDSFLFHETEGYDSGLIGYHKPLSQAIFGNYVMVEAIGTLLDPDVSTHWKWDATQWEAYCRLVLMTLRNYVETGFWRHSVVLHRATHNIQFAVSDLYKLNEVGNISMHDDTQEKLRIVVEFINKAVKILDEKGVPDFLQQRIHEKYGPTSTFYDRIAEMITEIISYAAAVRSPRGLCWWVQHNSLWGRLFHLNQLSGAAGKVVKFKVRRIIYNEIADMKRFPNFQGARYLGYCLNVMGLTIRNDNFDRDSRALQKAVLSWTKKNYAWLHVDHPRVAEACLVDGMSYDADNFRLVRTYPAEGLRREPHHIYFDVDPAAARPPNA